MTSTDFKPLPELEHEVRIQRAKLDALKAKKIAIEDAELAIKIEIERLEQEIFRYKS